MNGTLHLVGVGPGDPELLTLKAVRLLGAADVVAYPVSNEDTTIALDIARPHLNPAALVETIHIPMTVRLGQTGDVAAKQHIYDEAAARLALHLEAGRDVVYLCEGDPLFYGTAIYLLSHFRDAPQTVEVVPGVTSMTAAAAAVRLPLAAKAESLTVLTGLLPAPALSQNLALGGSFAILKLGRHYDKVRAALDDAGLAEHAWYIERASGAGQRLIRVRDLPPGDKPYFSLILIYSGAEDWN
ncbi:MAG: precorrin-2 C(20)-methyltransferase [Devosia sp.]